MEAVKFVALLALMVGAISGEVIETGLCGDPDPSAATCTIHEVRVEPCKENPHTCTIKKGKSASISFDYTTNFNATKLKSMAYLINELSDNTRFSDMGDDACALTPCPAEQAKRQTYTYRLQVSKKLPAGSFPIMWKLWNEDDKNQSCCFTTRINIKK